MTEEINTNKRREALKKYWASVPKEVRSYRMAVRRRKGWMKATKEQRKEVGKMLALARKKTYPQDDVAKEITQV